MLRRSPCELYIKYLIVHPDQYEDKDIKKKLRDEQLDFIGDKYIQSLRQGCVPPHPFYPDERYHIPSNRFLTKHGLVDIFFPDPHMHMARIILKRARAKEFVETMTLSGAPAMAIARQLSARYGVQATATAVEAYQRYFWNIGLLDSTEMRVLVNLRLEDDNDLEPGEKKALGRARHSDPRKLAAAMPNSPFGAMLAQMRMGMMPKVTDLAQMLQLGQFLLAQRMVESAHGINFDDHNRSMMWTVALKNVTDTMETVVKPDTELREKLSSLLLKTDPASVPVLAELSAGQHTAELEPTGDIHAESVAPVEDE